MLGNEENLRNLGADLEEQLDDFWLEPFVSSSLTLFLAWLKLVMAEIVFYLKKEKEYKDNKQWFPRYVFNRSVSQLLNVTQPIAVRQKPFGAA